MSFSHVLIIFVPAIFCILWYNFLLNVAIYAFHSFFQLLQPSGHHSRPDPRWGQGDREANPMWTQVGEKMNGGIVSGKGVICVSLLANSEINTPS